ncbi:MAG TPA: cation transporting ATPase C-terminal domain-containing protein, partial [Nitrospirales bacterium]|nr:cation transporting ATPase C-terminal domain-containing protein [Nitrospirales bacterium]
VLSRNGLFGNPYVPLTIGMVLGIQALFTYTEVMQTLFHTTDIDGLAWLRILGIGAVIYLLVELEKYVFRIMLKLRTPDLKV